MISFKRLASAAAGAGLVVAVATGCHSTHSVKITPSQSAAAHAAASALRAKCIPASAVKQIELARSLKTAAGRTAFEAACGVPPANKAQFEQDVLTAAEAGHLTTKAGRTTFFSVTLPKIVEENQG